MHGYHRPAHIPPREASLELAKRGVCAPRLASASADFVTTMVAVNAVESLYLTPIARPSVTDEIVERLLNFIIDEGLQPRDKLPSERTLMARLGVGRSSLREAIKTLSALGIVEVAVGEGMFVGGGQLSVLTRPLSWGLLMNQGSAQEVIEARRTVEVDLAGLAAARATAEEVAVVGQRLGVMRATLADAEAYSRSDLDFHRAIARAAHSRVLAHVLETLQHIVRVWIVENFLNFTLEDRLRTLEEEHAPIYEAIRAGDVSAARQAMASHLDAAGTRLLSVVAGRSRRR